jgi:hypothetical protein
MAIIENCRRRAAAPQRDEISAIENINISQCRRWRINQLFNQSIM